MAVITTSKGTRKVALSYGGVREWLESFDLDSPVTAKGVSNCPLNAYLIAMGATNSIVGCSGYSVTGQNKIPLPQWAQKFVRHIDEKLSGEDDDWSHITARECLRVLTQVGCGLED